MRTAPHHFKGDFMSENFKNYFTAEKIKLIQTTVAKDCTPLELELFLSIAADTGLDPLLRQIYPLHVWNYETNENVLQIVTGIDGARLVADRTKCYSPGKDTLYKYDAQGNFVSATVYIKKLAGGIWHEFGEEARFDEYARYRKDKKTGQYVLMRMWEKMRHTLTAKCGEMKSLRRGFPQLARVYIAEELDQSFNEPEEPKLSVEILWQLAQKNDIKKDEWQTILKTNKVNKDPESHTPEALEAVYKDVSSKTKRLAAALE
jgi:phage recombination protein Bet